MLRHRQWMNIVEAFGGSSNARILSELLVEAHDPALAHRLLRRFTKVTTVIAVMRRCILLPPPQPESATA